MIGGFYVTAVEKSTAVPGREYITIIAGPFATWPEADKAGPGAIAHVNQSYNEAAGLEWGICEFWFHRLVLGARNTELWTKPTPVER